MNTTVRRIAFTSILIGVLFFLNSSQYLSWFYILAGFFDAATVDFVGQFLGKIFQGIGILIFCGYAIKLREKCSRLVEFTSLIGLTYVFSTLAIAPPHRIICLVFGLLMNIGIGMLYAWYTAIVIDIVPKSGYGTTFGTGIGIGCLFSFILYKANPDYSFVTSAHSLYFYAFVSIFSIILLINNAKLFTITKNIENTSNEYVSNATYDRHFIIILFSALFLMSVVYGIGFFQPSGDLASFNISVEVMRLFYALSLMVAGYIYDKSQKLLFILCIIALTFTFSMPLLRDNATGVYVTWILAYLFTGFISVCRAVIFLEVAYKTKKYGWAAVGIFIGRVGDSLGLLLRVKLFDNNAILLLTISILFGITILLFVMVFSRCFLQPQVVSAPVEIDKHAAFIDRYTLSAREIQILDEILLMKSNKEIAASLFITESTVKFHVKNLMKKTNCKNRNELIKLYNEQ